jgi:hypothetical protein
MHEKFKEFWGNIFKKLSWVCKFTNKKDNFLWFSCPNFPYKNLFKTLPSHQIVIGYIHLSIAKWQNMETTFYTFTVHTI